MLNLVKNPSLVVLTILLWITPYCFAQDKMEKLLTKDGQLISEGTNTTPVGELNVTTYRLEIVSPVTRSEVEHETPPQNKLFRLTIQTQNELPMETFSIWIGDIESYGAVQVGAKSVILLRNAKSLPNGSSLGLSVRGKKDLASRSILPEKLFVPPEYATPEGEVATVSPIIKLRRLPNRFIQLRVEFSRGGCFDAMTGLLHSSTLEIEGFDPPPRRILFMCQGNDFVGHFSPDEFARIPNGANIILKVVNGNNISREVIGRLDKSAMQ